MKICKYEMHGGLCKKTGTYCNCWACLYEEPIEVTEVVRCKDCKYWKPSDARGGDSVDDMQTLGGCEYVRYCRREKDFCSYGERK